MCAGVLPIVLTSLMVRQQNADPDDPRTAFIRAATWHGSLDRAEAILASHPEIASADVHTAAVVGDDEAVRRFLEADPANAVATSPPHGGEDRKSVVQGTRVGLGGSRSRN